jgi:hypothetical protein
MQYWPGIKLIQFFNKQVNFGIRDPLFPHRLFKGPPDRLTATYATNPLPEEVADGCRVDLDQIFYGGFSGNQLHTCSP